MSMTNCGCVKDGNYTFLCPMHSNTFPVAGENIIIPSITEPAPCAPESQTVGHDEIGCDLAWERHCERHRKDTAKVRAELKATLLQIEGMQSVRDKLGKEIQFREKCIIEAMAERDAALRLNGEMRAVLMGLIEWCQPLPMEHPACIREALQLLDKIETRICACVGEGHAEGCELGKSLKR